MMLNYFMDLIVLCEQLLGFSLPMLKSIKKIILGLEVNVLTVKSAIGSVYVTTQSEVQGLKSLATRSLSNLWQTEERRRDVRVVVLALPPLPTLSLQQSIPPPLSLSTRLRLRYRCFNTRPDLLPALWCFCNSNQEILRDSLRSGWIFIQYQKTASF